MSDPTEQADPALGGGIPVYLDEGEPELDDPAADACWYRWQSASDLTNKLVRCVESVRDVRQGFGPLILAPDPAAEKRPIKQIIIPVWNLATGVRELYQSLQGEVWRGIPQDEKTQISGRYESFRATVNTKEGAVKTARDQIAAHIDVKIFRTGTGAREVWAGVELLPLLSWVRECANMLSVLLLPDVYAWTRESGRKDVSRIMNKDSWEIILHHPDGEGQKILGMICTRSPKYGIENEIREMMTSWYALQARLI